MNIQIRLLGIPPSVLNMDRRMVNLWEGATIRDAIRLLLQNNPHLGAGYFDPCTLLLNNRKAGWDTSLADGDTLMILRTLGGG
jgi:molybdopterin converting factor small subunit